MEKISRIERKKLETRKRILDISEQLFIREKGYEKITMREIARRADVSVGALYLHFTTKEDILATLFAKFTARQRKAVQKAVPDTGTGAEKIDCLLTFLDKLCHDPQFILYGQIPFFHLKRSKSIEDVIQNEIISNIDDFVSVVTDIMRDGIKDGTINIKADPVLAAVTLIDTFISLMLGVALQNTFSGLSFVTPRKYDSGSIFAVLRSFLSDGIIISSSATQKD